MKSYSIILFEKLNWFSVLKVLKMQKIMRMRKPEPFPL